MRYMIIDAVGSMSAAADRVGAFRVAAALHAVWRRLGAALEPSTFEFLAESR